MEHYIPKTKPSYPSNINDFHAIALLNVEGKLFFILISKQLVHHIITNNKNLINTSVQISRLLGLYVNGVVCLKGGQFHEIFFSKYLAWHSYCLWVIPLQIVVFCFRTLWPWSHWTSLIRIYYSGIYSCSFSQSARSSWHQHFKRIFAGCTFSVLLMAGINVVIEYTLVHQLVNLCL